MGMDRVEFRHGVGDGTILRIHCQKAWKGTTSVTYKVVVVDVKNSPEKSIFETSVTFVSLNDAGVKTAI